MQGNATQRNATQRKATQSNATQRNATLTLTISPNECYIYFFFSSSSSPHIIWSITQNVRKTSIAKEI
jgi:hypothetical protein